MKKNTNIKLKLTLAAHNQSTRFKKALMVPLLSVSLMVAMAQVSMARNVQPIELQHTQTIDNLRKFYTSPAKDLNNIIQKTGTTPQGLPVYSHVKGKTYINGKFSATRPVNIQQQPKQNVFNWLSDNGRYSRFVNDPVYTSNVQIAGTANRQAATNFKYDNLDTAVVTLRINNKIAYDFEVILWPDGSVSVPIKTLAQLVDVPVQQNHVNHNLSFTQPNTEDTVQIDYEKNSILVGTNLIEVRNPKLIYMQEGFLIENDIFVPEQIARDLLDVKTNFIQETYAFNLATDRVLKAFIQINEGADDSSSFVYEDPVNEVNTAQKQNKVFSLKQLNYRIGSSMNQTSGRTSNSNAAASAGFTATGNLFGGEYNIGASTNYGPQGMTIGGYRASLDYVRPRYELSLGATNARLSDLGGGSSIWGVRFGSVGAAGGSSIPRLIQGNGDDNSYVELYINGVLSDKALVQNGRFEFDSLKYGNEKTLHIVVEQIGEDGGRKKVYDRKFSTDAQLLAPGQKQFLVFSGIDSSAMSQQLYLFGDRFDRSYVQPVKYVSGARFRMGLSENLTMGVNVAKDFIIRQPSRLMFNNFRKLSSARAYRNGRSSSGAIVSIDMDYKPNDNFSMESEIGISSATSKVDPFFDPDGTDVGGFIAFNYRNPRYNLNGKAFSYGPDFYSPGSSSLMDKRGFELGASTRVGPVNLSGFMTRYNSNLDNYFEGGQATVMDYSLYASGKIDEYSTLRAGVRSQGAENSFYFDRDITYDVTLNRKLSSKADMTVNYARTVRKTQTPSTTQVTTSSNNTLNAQLNYDAGKLGIVRLSHEMMMLDPVDRILLGEVEHSYFTEPIYSKNLRITLDRSQQPIKGVIVSPNVGYRYGGQNKGFNFGVNLGYMFRSGRQIALNYAYNSSFGKYISGAFSFGGNRSHTLSLNFSDTLGFGVNKNMNQGPQSAFDATSGIVKGAVFADLNQNGVRDPGEDGLAGIDVNFQNLFTVTTDDKGEFIATVNEGLRKVGVDKETLPVIYTPTVADALVNVKRERVYVANLGLIVTPGSISGQVEVDKEGISNTEVIVLLLDKNGREVKYTTTDSRGGFYIGSVAPGEYTVVVDKNYMDYKGLQMAEQTGEAVTIPLVTDDFVDIEDINFTLVPKRGEVKKF
jgi:hypothetical protein